MIRGDLRRLRPDRALRWRRFGRHKAVMQLAQAVLPGGVFAVAVQALAQMRGGIDKAASIARDRS
jgi:hypothetical protein